jgi:ferredoxin
VTDNCQKCRFTECVAVCPVSCFHADNDMVYVDRDVCIECAACIPVCPVKAIFDTIDLPDDKRGWDAINETRARQLPVISKKQSPLPTADARRAELGFAV